MKMIVGLGNPGRQYAGTKHNMGFMVVDGLAQRMGLTLNKLEFDAATATTRVHDEKVFLVKPQTYMNASGRAVRQLMMYYQIRLDEILVVHDDMDLTLGKLRLRQRGSAGGHNGIKNIIAHLGTQEFPRIKIGTGAPAGGGAEMIDWVIGVPSQAERKILVESFENAVKAAEDIIENGCQKAMNDYN